MGRSHVDAERMRWRPATAAEINHYYREEFPKKCKQQPKWITTTGPHRYAVEVAEPNSVGQESSKNRTKHTTRHPITRHTRGAAGPTFPDWDSLVQFLTDPVTPESQYEKSLEPVVRDIYYTVSHHERFRPLLFAINGKTIAREEHEQAGGRVVAGSIPDDASIVTDHPAGYPYRYEHIETAIEHAFTLSEWLESSMEFDDTRVVYAGTSAHVYGLDTDPFHQYDIESRKLLSHAVRENLGISIDPQVTWDTDRMARMPYSLHTGISRIATPITSHDFDFCLDSEPIFTQYDDVPSQDYQPS